MNIDKVNTLVQCYNKNTRYPETPHIWSKTAIESPHLGFPGGIRGKAYISSCPLGIIIEGSPLSWFYSQNICGPDMIQYLDIWAKDVISTYNGSLSCIIKRLTAAEVFWVNRLASRGIIDQTLFWLQCYARIHGSRYDMYLYPSENIGLGTLYSRPIEGYSNKSYLLRLYNKADQLYSYNSDSLIHLVVPENTLKIESAFGSNNVHKILQKAQREGRPLSTQLLAGNATSRLSNIRVYDPSDPPDPNGLTYKQLAMINRWKTGIDINPDMRTVREIRSKVSYDLRKPYSYYTNCEFDPSREHASVEELLFPQFDIEPELWAKAQEILGLSDLSFERSL